MPGDALPLVIVMPEVVAEPAAEPMPDWGTAWTSVISITPSVLPSVASMGFRDKRILRSRAVRSALSCFSSSSFFQISFMTCLRTGLSR